MSSQASSWALADALALYQRECLASRNLAPLTREAYLRDLDELAEFLADRVGIRQASRMTREHLEGFLSELDRVKNRMTSSLSTARPHLQSASGRRLRANPRQGKARAHRDPQLEGLQGHPGVPGSPAQGHGRPAPLPHQVSAGDQPPLHRTSRGEAPDRSWHPRRVRPCSSPHVWHPLGQARHTAQGRPGCPRAREPGHHDDLREFGPRRHGPAASRTRVIGVEALLDFGLRAGVDAPCVGTAVVNAPERLQRPRRPLVRSASRARTPDPKSGSLRYDSVILLHLGEYLLRRAPASGPGGGAQCRPGE